MIRIFHWFFMWEMDPMSGFGIRLVFTLPPRDSTLQYKRCKHLWNNFPCIKTLNNTSSTFLIYPIFKLTQLQILNLSPLQSYLNTPLLLNSVFPLFNGGFSFLLLMLNLPPPPLYILSFPKIYLKSLFFIFSKIPHEHNYMKLRVTMVNNILKSLHHTCWKLFLF